MKTLKTYLILFLVLSSQFLLANDIILFSDISETPDQYGFFQFELRLASTLKKEYGYILKIYQIPNQHIMLADGDKVYTGDIKPLEDKQFIIYLKPIKAGSGEVLFKAKVNTKEYVFKSKYEVKNTKIFDEEKLIEVEKLGLKIFRPIEVEKQIKKDIEKKENTEQLNTNNVVFTFSEKGSNNWIKILLAIFSISIIALLFYYKKRTRFHK